MRIELQGEGVIHPYWRKVSTRSLVLQSEDLREEPRRGLFVMHRNNRMVQDDCHGDSCSLEAHITTPPPAWMFWPVSQRARSLTTNATTSAMSSGVPTLFSGDICAPLS